MKTLVCVVGQIRIPNRIWSNFKKNVLEQTGADLALCIHDNGETDRTNEFYKNAKYIFEYKNTTGCWATAFDQMNPGWRTLLDVPGDWLAPIKEPVERKSSGGLLLFMWWFLYQNIKSLLGEYDRVILTHSENFWKEAHPVLDNEHIWMPRGEFHGGLPNRYIVIPKQFVEKVLTIGHMGDPVATGNALRRRFFEMRMNFLFNIEGFIYVRFHELDLLRHVAFFPRCMFLASETRGVYQNAYAINAVYPDELDEDGGSCITWPWYIEHRYLSRNGMFCGRVTSA